MAKQPLSRHSKPKQAAAQEKAKQPTGQPGHTPGPWRVAVYGKKLFGLGQPGDGAFFILECVNDSVENPAAQADARLIAAAPDLLAACKTVDAALEAGFEDRETADDLSQLVRAAIAKATGYAPVATTKAVAIRNPKPVEKTEAPAAPMCEMSDLREWFVWEEGHKDDRRFKGFIPEHAIEKFCEEKELDGYGGFEAFKTIAICIQPIPFGDIPIDVELPVEKFEVYVGKTYSIAKAREVNQ